MFGEILAALDLIQEMVKLFVEKLDTSTLVSLLGFGFSLCTNLHFLLGAQIFSISSFGRGTGPVLLAGLSCTGTEYSLADCPQTSPSYSSYYGGHIGVRCLQKGSLMIVNSILVIYIHVYIKLNITLYTVVTPCTHGAVRLRNGSTSDEGRVEICVNREWGSVCDSNWGRREAQVVCRQLGYNPSCEELRATHSHVKCMNKICIQGLSTIGIQDLVMAHCQC